MRLPMNDDKVDLTEFSKTVDTFIENGFNYFDTAHGYLDGKSKIAIKNCLTSRYPMDSYILTVKADACHACRHCDRRCPFKVKQQERMAKIAEYFLR